MGQQETVNGQVQENGMEMNVSDMTKISNINIEIINKNLWSRYNQDTIYTYIDNILLAINPYKELDIYGFDYIHQYTPAKESSRMQPIVSKSHHLPHIFSITQKCYEQLTNRFEESVPQSILISGESGSGKTETSKFVLQYLCEISSNENYWLQEQILEGNVILEAFGNATTVRNNNSSRFGKFLQIYFSHNAITGAVVTNYLLEKSRIVGQSQHERNYHIFYQLLSSGASLEKYGLQPIQYKYCNQFVPGAPGTTHATDHTNWNHLLVSLNVLEFSPDSINTIFSLLAVILWFGNLEFMPNDEDVEISRLTPESLEILNTIGKLLQLSPSTLQSLLLQRQITIRGIVTDIPFRPMEASDNRHSMSQYLYMKIFNYLVYFINSRINRDIQGVSTFVGLLDIFGFENFTKNSFEQLCINYSNEKLQGYFNEYIFRMEQEMYQSEGLDFSYISFVDNSTCLEFLERTPRSLLKLLSEQCHLPKGSDGSFLQNLTTEHSNHASFNLPTDRRFWKEQFNVVHYAGAVTYTVEGFVNKNRHLVQDGFHNYLLDNDMIKCIISCNDKVTTATLKYKSTLIEDFRQELSSLMSVLQSSEPWYIRCLKPNFTKTPNNYDSNYILEQLNYLGIVDLVKIKQMGYPVNYGFSEFANKYKILVKSKGNVNIDTIIAKASEGSQKFSRPEDFQLGTSRIFLRNDLHTRLESARNWLLLQAAIKIQARWRSYIVKNQFRVKITAAIRIQRYYRSLKQRLHFLKLKKSALIIQSHLRGKFGREVVKSMKEMKRIEKELRDREEERRNSSTSGSNYNSVDELLDLLLNEEGSPEISKRQEVVKTSASINSSFTSLTDDDYDMNEEDDDESASVNENDSLISDFDRSQNSINTIQSPIQSTAPSEGSEVSEPLPPPEVLPEQQVARGHAITGKIIPKHPPTLPEPTLPPPPPPTFYPPPPPPACKNPPLTKSGSNPDEPIYESVRLANGIVKHLPEEPPKVPDLPPPETVLVEQPVQPSCLKMTNGRNHHQDSNPGDIEIDSDDSSSPSRQQPLSYDLINYANDYFNDIYESNLMDTLKKKPKLIPKSDMLKYSKCNTISNSHIYLYDPDNIQLALNIWKELQKYLTSTRSGNTHFVRTLVTHGLEHEELRDEIYIQILRQLNGNPNVNATLKLLGLLQFVMRIFQCSSELKKYLGHFLNKVGTSTGDSRIHNQIAALLKSTVDIWGNRKVVPSLIEVNYYFQHNQQQLIHHIKLYLLNNSYLLLNIHPADTYGSLLGKLSLLLKTEFINDGTWGIYESNSELTEMYYLQKYDHVYDLIASWERSNEITSQTTPPNLLLLNPRKKLVLKKRLFKAILPSPTHPLEINLNYLQCIHEVIRLDKYTVSEKVGVALAGIQLQVLLGNYKPDEEFRMEDTLPPRLLKLKSTEQWTPLLEDSHYQVSQLNENKFSLQLRYLNCVRKLNFYGTTLFNLSYYGYRDYDPHLLLGINATQLLLIQQDMTVLNSIAYEEIQTLQIQDESLVINLPATKFVFKTKFTDDIFTLITSYYPKLKRTEAKFSHPLITNGHRSKLLRNLVDARNLLIANNYLNFDKGTNTLKSKNRKQFSAYFTYSKTALAHSLLKLNQSEEAAALETFKFILSYTQGDGPLKPFLIRLANNNLLNEVYLQLIKQTNSVMPNSALTRRTWALLNLLANYLLPTNKLIMNYLLTHLKYFAMDGVTVVGDYAKIVMKSLQNTNSYNKVTKAVRKFIPSSTEISFLIHFKPISVKIYLLNNNYYTVDLANHYDTVQDVLGVIFNYVGLNGLDCRGYGIYETSTLNGSYCESYLVPATTIVDVLSRWEGAGSPARGNGQTAPKYKLVFKKYLTKHLNLNNPIEKELLLQQLLFNIKTNKYPINTNEGEILIALLSQIHLGNYEQMDPGEFPDYCSILSKYFPTNLSVNISYERVSYYHQSLVGSQAEDSYKSIFNLLTSWPLYRGSLFSVVQSFTPSWPRNLWLIVDETGIFLLEERTKNVIANYNFSDLLNYIPTTNYLMLIVRSEAKGVKIILNTSESYSISYLIREYINSK